MPEITDFLKLEKPFDTENYSIGVFNRNADKLDAELKKQNTALLNKANIAGATFTGQLYHQNVQTPYWNGANMAIEQGEWLPTLMGGDVHGQFNYAFQDGAYYRIGKWVHVHARIQTIDMVTAPSGSLYLSGLPFASRTHKAPYSVGNVGLMLGIKLGGTHTPVVMVANYGTYRTAISLHYNRTDTGGYFGITSDMIQANGVVQLYLSLLYQTN